MVWVYVQIMDLHYIMCSLLIIKSPTQLPFHFDAFFPVTLFHFCGSIGNTITKNYRIFTKNITFIHKITNDVMLLSPHAYGSYMYQIYDMCN